MDVSRQELTEAAIDWAVNNKELYDIVDGDAEALADLAIENTWQSLGNENDDVDEVIDREQVILAIQREFDGEG